MTIVSFYDIIDELRKNLCTTYSNDSRHYYNNDD